MGGRGSSSGFSVRGVPYGSEYKELYSDGDFKFIKQVEETSIKTPMETMTKHRVYVLIGNDDEIKSIVMFSDDGLRKKQIDLTHLHKIEGERVSPHTHEGYWHDENGTHKINADEADIVDKVQKIWNSFRQGNRKK